MVTVILGVPKGSAVMHGQQQSAVFNRKGTEQFVDKLEEQRRGKTIRVMKNQHLDHARYLHPRDPTYRT